MVCVPFFFFPALTTVTSGHVAAGRPCLCCGLTVEKSEPDAVENEKKSDYLAATDVLIYSIIKASDWISAGSGPLRATGREDKVGSSGGENDLNKPGFSFSLQRTIFNAGGSMDASFLYV